ncbi:MAG: hypothetical protein NTZ29_16565, partial [Verrucomicrobia bacterium]|nr:hypothetical protein [Verrucomicrobiota bacterium]
MRNLLLASLICLLASAARVSAQPVALQNQLYRIEVAPAAIVVTRLDAPGLTREIRPELTLQFTATDPGYTDARAEGATRVAAWKAPEAKAAVHDFWSVGAVSALRSTRVVATAARTAELEFPPSASGRLTLVVRLDEGSAPPAFTWRLTATQPGWFSVGFTGVSPRDPASLNFLYQPLVWSWKRFPVAPVLTPENFATTAAVFTNVASATEGLAPDV